MARSVIAMVATASLAAVAHCTVVDLTNVEDFDGALESSGVSRRIVVCASKQLSHHQFPPQK